MTTAEFVTIKRSDMEQWLTKHYSSTWQPTVDVPGREVIYDIQTSVPGIVYRLYSSLVSGVNVSRGVGEDAIRFVLYDVFSDRPLTKTKRVHRTEGATTVWDRMMDRIEDLAGTLHDINFCPKCGSAMALREPRPGQHWKPFYGCTSFPNCKGTRRQDAVGKGLDERLKLGKAAAEDEMVEEQEAEANGAGEVEQMTILDEVPPAESSTEANEVPTEFLPTAIFPLIDYPFESFQPIQGALAKELTKPGWDENIICSAPTGAGKTVLAEMTITKCIEEEGKKAIYASPFKALTQEKLDEWRQLFCDYKISIVTGDYTLTDKRVKELHEADIILLTTEMLDSRTRRMEAEKNTWLMNVGVVVLDESHIITMKDRGDKVESGLMRFCAINPSAKIVCISATMPNVEEMAGWLTKINGKKTTLLKSSWRPVNLNVHAVPYSGVGYWDKEDSKAELAMELIKRYEADKFMVFVHSKKTGYSFLRDLKNEGIEADFHSADLDLEKRLEIEASFKDRENGIRVLVSTSTTAWGVNMPARRCIIFGVTRGLAPVDVMDIIQEIGRSGRPGLDPEGDAYILCPYSDTDPLGGPEFWGNIIQHCPPIRSQMLDHKVLGFHICAELGRKPMGLERIKDWYSRSLAAHQGIELPDYVIEPLLEDLVEIGCIELDPAWNTYKLTGLGRVSAWLYYDPWSVAAWYSNFNLLFENYPDETHTEEMLGVCLANIPAYEMEYVPKEWQNRVDALAHRFGQHWRPFRSGCGVMMLAASDMMANGEVPNGLNVFYRTISWDMMRIVQALKLIDSQQGKWGRQKWFEILGLRVRYGVPSELVELVEIDGIGAVRAKKLGVKGVKNLKSFLDNLPTVRKILGPAISKKAIADAKRLAKEKEVGS